MTKNIFTYTGDFLFKSIDFSPGKITSNNLDFNPLLPLNDTNYYLTEDMMQVVYDKNITLDVSWFRSIKKFVVVIVQGDEPEIWMNPLFEKRCKNLKELEATLIEYTEIIRNMLAKVK